ncbi:hypothetical protein TIFTF001_019072 [Ficus carica]|uniref:Uncharacterized protein n=1 Tax=Ficus carica TaxID=3494 RepID=A0AA88ASK4_FICCA|nr:hypothetical protein TIFTF001_019072 [Ficus carica]
MDQNEKVGYASTKNGISTTPANIPSHSLHVGAPTIPVSAGTGGGGFMRQDWRSNRKSLLKSIDCFGLELAMQEQAAIAIMNPNTREPTTLTVVAVATGLLVMIIIFSTGHISGAHLNPAVTIAFAALKHFPWKHVPIYIGAQVSASLCASYALKVVLHPITGSGGVTVPTVDYGQAFALEFIVTFVLMPRTGASMNPVRTLGPAVAAHNFKAIWIYLTAPVLGALCGAAAYTAVKLPEEDGDNEEKP